MKLKKKTYLSVSSGEMRGSVHLRSGASREAGSPVVDLLVVPSLRVDDQPRYQPSVSVYDDWEIDFITIDR